MVRGKDDEMRELLADFYETAAKDLQWTDGLIRMQGTGHTAEMASLDHCHNGRTSAACYAVGTVSRKLDEQMGYDVLQALQSLQVTDSSSPHYGCFRWYREETRVNDTNAAFFIMLPLAVVRLLFPQSVPDRHVPLIDDMLARGADWFVKECENPSLFYPNKIVSDGAMLLAISRLCNQSANYQTAVQFFYRWCEYTERRGWGWGENISLTYLRVILNSLQLACMAFHPDQEQLKQKLVNMIDEIIETIRFHGGVEFSPTIRSYNFDGNTCVKSLLWVVAGVRTSIAEELGEDAQQRLSQLLTLMVFKDRIPLTSVDNGRTAESVEQIVPRIRRERIFDDTFAYSWVGRHGRMGSVNRFPVMPGCYQHPTWGLGWQSYPVTFAVHGEQVSYLRWVVREGENVRTHPARSKASYLNPALFREDYYPEVETYCSQNENALLVLRSMSRLHNQASEIVDEWVIHRFSGAVITYLSAVSLSPRKWVILTYPHVAVAISALDGIRYPETKRSEAQIVVEQEGDTVCLKQHLYSGEERVLHHPRLEAGWAVVLLDQSAELTSIETYLDRVEITDDVVPDFEIPRTPHTQARKIVMAVNKTVRVSLSVDPVGVQSGRSGCAEVTPDSCCSY